MNIPVELDRRMKLLEHELMEKGWKIHKLEDFDRFLHIVECRNYPHGWLYEDERMNLVDERGNVLNEW